MGDIIIHSQTNSANRPMYDSLLSSNSHQPIRQINGTHLVNPTTLQLSQNNTQSIYSKPHLKYKPKYQPKKYVPKEPNPFQSNNIPDNNHFYYNADSQSIPVPNYNHTPRMDQNLPKSVSSGINYTTDRQNGFNKDNKWKEFPKNNNQQQQLNKNHYKNHNQQYFPHSINNNRNQDNTKRNYNEQFQGSSSVQSPATINNLELPPTHSNLPIDSIAQTSTKLSRNQKRKIKKATLLAQFQSQSKQLGSLIYSERKDLVKAIQQIEQNQQIRKQNKLNKYPWLVRIGDELAKTFKNKAKNNQVSHLGKTVSRRENKKKKIGWVKRMKNEYQRRNKKQNVDDNEGHNDQQWVSEEQTQIESEKEQNHNVGKVIQNDKKQQANNSYLGVSQFTFQRLQKQGLPLQTQQISPNKTPSCIKASEISFTFVSKISGTTYQQVILREWVTNVPNMELDELVMRLINRLAYKQAIKKANKPDRAKKLIVSGLHQSRRTLKARLEQNKSKALIIALNIQRNNLERGTDDQVLQLIALAEEARIPVVHCLTRAKLGLAFTGNKGPKLSVVSIINLQGTLELAEQVLEVWKQSKAMYDNT